MKSKKGAKIPCLLIPFFMVLIAESVTGNLKYMTVPGILLNLAVYYLLYAGVLVIFGSAKYGWPVLNLLLYALAAGEYFVISFRERPIMIWDVLALRTAMTVSANYNYVITPRLVITFLAALAAGFFAWKRPLTIDKKKGSFFGPKSLWAGSVLAFGALLFGGLSPALGLDVHMWDPIVSFEKEGFLLSTVLSLKNLFPARPLGYGESAVKELEHEFSEIENAESAAGEVNPEVIICIMNESFSDLRIYNGLNAGHSFETDGEFLSYFDSLSGNTQKGKLYVPVFGAMTANSEYEFLTGNSCAFVPQGSIPYQFFTKPNDSSLAADLGSHGYRTVAMHPYPGYNWNRTRAYENLGFDEFLDQEYYEDPKQEFSLWKPRGYMSDRSDYDGIIRLLEEKKPGEKLFIFNVTMQNHGGYEVEGLEASVHVSSVNGRDCMGQYPKADQYLTLMKMSDEALEYLLRYLEGRTEPVLVVLFGDHQPSVETELFEELYGMRWSEVPDAMKLNSFVTPYLIWSNYDRETGESRDMSAFMLGNQVLKEAGILLTGKRAAAEALQKKFQAVHSMGVLTRDGTFSGIVEMKNMDAIPDIRKFHILQYHEIFGK